MGGVDGLGGDVEGLGGDVEGLRGDVRDLKGDVKPKFHQELRSSAPSDSTGMLQIFKRTLGLQEKCQLPGSVLGN